MIEKTIKKMPPQIGVTAYMNMTLNERAKCIRMVCFCMNDN